MWPFSSSSNTADSSSPASGPSTSGAPNREQRAVCWKARDDYFDCLIRNKVMVPGEEGEGVCKIEIGEYEKNCGKTWIEHFNKRKATELKQQVSMGYRPPPGR